MPHPLPEAICRMDTPDGVVYLCGFQSGSQTTVLGETSAYSGGDIIFDEFHDPGLQEGEKTAAMVLFWIASFVMQLVGGRL